MTSLRMHFTSRVQALADIPKNEIKAVLIVLLLPLVVNLPSLLDWWSVDPMHFVSGIASLHGKQVLLGYPWIDPSVGFYSQALGKLAADEWLSGRVPWWNYYSGVGLPLAAEMSPGALFLPLVLLNHFANGTLYIKVVLQILAGLGTYFLLRKIGLVRLSAVAGAVLYEFSGVFAWHAAPIINPIAFLPWLIFGIESARERSLLGSARGWLIIAISLAFSIYAGFPETAYINALLAGVWFLWRLFSAPPPIRYRFIVKMVTGIIVGLLLSMPAIIPFVEFCGYSYLGGHALSGGFGALRSEALPQLFFPWLYGSIFSYFDNSNVAYGIWGKVGGYLSAAQMTVIALGLFTPRRASLHIVLAFWILICLGRTFGLPFVSPLVDFVPLLKQTAFYRYSAASWEFCSAVSCAFVINDITSGSFRTSNRLVRGLLVASVIAAFSLYPGYTLIRDVYAQDGYAFFLYASLAWGFGSMLALALFLKLLRNHHLIAGYAVTALLALDAIVIFSVSSFSAVKSSPLMTAGVNFLINHIGMDRFYTLGPIPPNFSEYGPIAPNYGAYYGIASINHNYIPVAQNWVNYLKNHIDPYSDPVCFTGNFPRASRDVPLQGDVLIHNLPKYAELGVRYVVTPHEKNPFQSTSVDASKQDGRHPLRVFESRVMDIYELSETKPYFETVQGTCDVHGESRSVVSVNCGSDSELIRRELFYPGWIASARGQKIKIEPYDDIFQAIKIPPGKYKITFTYSPTHWRFILMSFLLGVSWVIIDLISTRSRFHRALSGHIDDHDSQKSE
jgi:hypothetical protein